MKRAFLLPLAFLVASCAAQSSLSDQPIILSNGTKASLYYRAMGLKSSRGITPEKTIPFASNEIRELEPGNQALLEPPKSYASEGGIAILVYRSRSIEGLTELLFAGLREVTIQQLESGIPIVLE